ncbi:dihydrolipoamide acetyltransferase family protein [Salinirarus marinus]|uniref:dihydrolipoamide acetyltransferase family protein n=1 Tax=Salinirarus marinus TaxID=3068310 RepID=UPI003C6C69AE
MAYIVKMPKLGLEMEQGTVLEWHVGEGDAVSDGDLIAEIESEKSVGEIEAREDGVLRRIVLREDEVAEPGTPMGIVAGADEDISTLEAQLEAELDSGETAEPTEEETSATAAESGGGDGGGESVTATPRARRRAEELGVDLSSVDGTGPQGAVTESDVETAAESDGEGGETGGASRTLVEERPFSGMRRTIAERLGESYRNAVHVTEHRTADAEELLAATDAAEEALGVDVSLPDVLLVALSAALSEHPAFNATFEDDTHRLYEEHNVGVAVDIEAGLIAPVLPDVGSKSLAGVASERRELTRRALDGDYTTADLRGGTFTVTNLGVLGVESFDPVINPPQVAILGVNRVLERPVRGDDDGVEWRRALPLDLSFDHRVVDGADAARFLGTLVDHLEDPWPLLPDGVSR